MEENKVKNRTEIIFELAKYCHQDHYQGILTWPTEHLRALLEYYQRPETKPRRAAMLMVVEIGIDLAEGEDKSVVFQWPFAYKAVGEGLKNKQRFSDMRPKR